MNGLNQIMSKDNSPILLLVTPEDVPYLGQLKELFKNRQAFFIHQNPDSSAEIAHYAKSRKCKYVITTNRLVLNQVVQAFKPQSLDDWNGSIYESMGITYLFLNPFKQFYTVPYGRFVAERLISKIINPRAWKKTPEFTWELAKPETVNTWYKLYSQCIAIAVDIETITYPEESEDGNTYTLIRCICYTGLWPDGNIHTIVLPISEAAKSEHLYWITWMRKFNTLMVPKIFQNGLYDNGHLICYASPCSQYYWDTQSLFHAWFSELPKRLDFISAFLVHNIFYWKQLGTQSGKLFEYNARDGWATMCSFLALMEEMPEWAIKNYLIKFPLWVPCLAGNLEGSKVSATTRTTLIEKYKTEYELIRKRLNHWLGGDFNPNSPQQVTKLINFYGSIDIDSSGEAELLKFGLRHPINSRFAKEIIRAREVGKIISTYLKPEDFSVSAKTTKKKTPLLKNRRFFYSLNPDGTDTGRFSCKESIFWTGSNFQNQPESVKALYEADPGFDLYEIDNEKSESWCVAMLSGDEILLADVSSEKDFHAITASRYFGTNFDEIIAETEDKNIPTVNTKRFIAKRINHGSKFNMREYKLLEVIGEKAIDDTKKLLKLPSYWTRIQTCVYLLEQEAKTYKGVKIDWYTSIKELVSTTHKLVSPLGWTRHCFGNPKKSNHEFSALLAHSSQNLSGGIINQGMADIYWKVQIPNPKDFRIKAQIHDSIFFQVRRGYEQLAIQARELCIRPINVTDCKGISRIMTIPVSLKKGKNWLDMEKVK